MKKKKKPSHAKHYAAAMAQLEKAAADWVATHACATQRQYRAAVEELRRRFGIDEITS